jgi:Fe-S cluster biogenesis protein NfuA
LHPESLEARVGRALASVRPYLGSHGGGVTLLGVSAGIARLQMEGSCQGCPSSAATMKQTIEQAIFEAAPDLLGIELVENEAVKAPAELVQLEALRSRASNPMATTP